MPSKQVIEDVKRHLELGDITPSKRIELLAKLMGYREVPPTAEEILEDEFFLGKVYGKGKQYPFWREMIRELYPDPITSSAFVVILKGAIGTGKSVGGAIPIMGVDLVRLSYLEDPAGFFGLMSDMTPWTLRFFNINLAKCGEIFTSPFMHMIEISPYWQEYRERTGMFLPQNLQVHSSSRARQVLSEALFGFVVSEVNFYKPEAAKDIIDTCLGRNTSRFEFGSKLLCHGVLDSSDTYEDSVVETFIREGSYADRILIKHVTSWDAKKHKGYYFQSGSFEVYLGDSTIRPFIMEGSFDREKLDPERILVCPREIYQEAKSDLIKTLQDKAGYSVMSGDLFFTNSDILDRHYTLPNTLSESYTISSSVTTPIIEYIGVSNILSALDTDRPVYARLDLGVSHDAAGIALVQFSHIKETKRNDGKIIKHRCFNVPVAFALDRPAGDETIISRIRDFFIELNDYIDIRILSTDQYQSTQLRQELKLAGIDVKQISVESDYAYTIYKLLLLEDRIKCVESKLVDSEFKNLVRKGNNVDHKPTSTKDVVDAIVGAVLTAYEDEEVTIAVSKKKSMINFKKVLGRTLEKRNKLNYRLRM